MPVSGRASPRSLFRGPSIRSGGIPSWSRGIADEVNKLKEHPGKDLSVAGAEMASTFMQLGLIDEYWLYVRPVVLGGDKPMFSPVARQDQLTAR